VITNIAFTVPGEPQGKGRARVGTIGGHARMFTPERTVAYEGLIAMAARDAMRGTPPFDCALRVELDIVQSVPASWSKKKRSAALSGAIRPTTKPDKDNVIKAVYDGGNGVVWRDDVLIVDGAQSKRYGETPGVHVRVAVLGGEGSLL